jgi:hypothetical protein
LGQPFTGLQLTLLGVASLPLPAAVPDGGTDVSAGGGLLLALGATVVVALPPTR